jgi:hypothetical protein
MNWIMVVAVAWPATAVLAALVLGRAIGVADEQAACAPNFVVEPAFTIG